MRRVAGEGDPTRVESSQWIDVADAPDQRVARIPESRVNGMVHARILDVAHQRAGESLGVFRSRDAAGLTRIIRADDHTELPATCTRKNDGGAGRIDLDELALSYLPGEKALSFALAHQVDPDGKHQSVELWHVATMRRKQLATDIRMGTVGGDDEVECPNLTADERDCDLPRRGSSDTDSIPSAALWWSALERLQQGPMQVTSIERRGRVRAGRLEDDSSDDRVTQAVDDGG